MMMASFLLAALQPAVMISPPVPNCALVTPRGDALDFFIWSAEGEDGIRLTPLQGSAWPTGTITGSRAATQNVRILLGARDGLVLELKALTHGESRRTATLFLRDGQRPTLPVAYGFCRDAPITVDPPEPVATETVGADNPAFNPDLWPDGDCGLVLGDGRRIRLIFRLQNRDTVRLQSPELWSRRPVITTIRWLRSGNETAGLFSERGGFAGIRTMAVEGTRAVELIRLSQLGEPPHADMDGYGICGHRAIERRPGP